MRLSAQPPRRFSIRRAPDYPVLTAACAVAATAACGAPAHPTTPATSAPPTQLASASTARPAQPWTKPHTSRFPVDDAPLAKGDVKCAGDCPSPFEIAAEDHDRAMVQARVDYCVERAEHVAPVPPKDFTVEGEIDRVGASSKVELAGADDVASAVTACVVELVRSARFLPPQGADRTRRLWAPVSTHKQP